MRARNSARERADAAAEVPAGGADGRGFGWSIPQLPGQCSACLRWLNRDRLCAVPVGDDDICGLCAAVIMVTSSVPTAVVTDSEEEAAIAALRVAYNLIRHRAPTLGTAPTISA